MFTGIIQQQAQLNHVEAAVQGLRWALTTDFPEIIAGESIAVDGICLTAIEASTQGEFICELSPETLAKTTAGTYQVGQTLNIERALRMGDALGGHLVSGHVDEVAHVAAINPQAEFTEMIIDGCSQPSLLSEKGSVAINGVSLTINSLTEGGFSIMLIPHTLAETNLSILNVGDSVNIEYDQLAKLVQRQLEAR